MKSIIGAVIGDVVGSTYEVFEWEEKRVDLKRRLGIFDKGDNLFESDSSFTDDSVLTCAVADAILKCVDFQIKLREFGLKEENLGLDKYGRSKFGSGFLNWLHGGANKSLGNGCAMRVSPIGYAFDTLNETLRQAEICCKCTHDNVDTINMTKAVAGAIFLARNNKSKDEIKEFCLHYVPSLDFDLGELQKTYMFDVKAIGSVPQAIYCFLISNDFVETLKNSISIGGDSDTIACIACSIAGAYYGVPNYLIDRVKKYIPNEYLKIINDFDNKFCIEN